MVNYILGGLIVLAVGYIVVRQIKGMRAGGCSGSCSGCASKCKSIEKNL